MLDSEISHAMIFYRMCCMQFTSIPIISMIKDMAKWIVLRDEFFLSH